MASFVTQAVEIVDLFADRFKSDKSEFGTGFAPANQSQVDEILRPGMFKDLDEQPPVEKLREEFETLKSHFELSLTQEQKQLKAALDKAGADLTEQAASYGESGVELEECKEEYSYAMLAFQDSLSDDQKDAFSMIDRTALEIYLHLSSEGQELLAGIKEELDSLDEVLRNEEISKEIISIDIPEEMKNYSPMEGIIASALKRQGIGLETDAESESGYTVISDNKRRMMYLVKTSDAQEIDFEAIKNEINTSIQSELASPDNWREVRSALGIAYQYTSPYHQDDLTQEVMWLESFGSGEENPGIKSGVLINGVFHDEVETEEIPSGTKKVIRVSGDAIQNVLVDKLGVSNLKLPPQRER